MKQIWALASVSMFMAFSSVDAAIVHPTGIGDNTQYRFMFISTTGTNATSTTIGDYDNIVAGDATTHGVDTDGVNPIIWRAVVSVNGGDDALTHISVDNTGGWDIASVPIYLVNTNTLIANNFADLFNGSIAVKINRQPNGNIVADATPTWTGSASNGTASNPLGTFFPNRGRAGSVNGDWIAHSNQFNAENQLVYGISNVLVTPTASVVPEPSSLAMLLIAVGAVPVARRWRKR